MASFWSDNIGNYYKVNCFFKSVFGNHMSFLYYFKYTTILNDVSYMAIMCYCIQKVPDAAKKEAENIADVITNPTSMAPDTPDDPPNSVTTENTT